MEFLRLLLGGVVFIEGACFDPVSARGPQYKNVRPDYVKEVWKVVNWKNVGENLAKAK